MKFVKKLLLLLILSLQLGAFAQEITFGKVSKEELQMSFYEKDSSAKAVVLHENGHVYFNIEGKNKYTKEYYVRIKIFKKTAFDKATIKIPFYKKSRVKKIEAVTYNLNDSGEIEKTFLEEKNIFKEKYNKSYNIKSFSLPNVKVGSVIEYRFIYSINSYGIYDWSFQSDIPKIKSIYKAYLSGRPKFKIRLIGFLKPSVENARLKKKCVGISRCSELYYEFENVPAFVEEKYLTSKYNYLSRLTFEREYSNSFVRKGRGKEDWKALDKGFEEVYKYNLNLDAFYRKNIPDFLLKEENSLIKAKNIYNYIQKRFTKDNNSNFRFNEVLEKKVATTNQINLALYNAFNAAYLNTELVFLSTRKNGFVTKLHATVVDFNYIIVKLKVGKEEFLLDASDKLNPFGLISFQCLNGNGRVINFKKGSYWEQIKPSIKSNKNTKINLTLKDGELTGDISLTYNGYDAKLKREELTTINEEAYIEDFESDYPDIEVEDYTNENLKNLSPPFSEKFKVLFDLENIENLSINPFLINRLIENPFKLNIRKYPVDYGYKRSERYLFSLNIPDGYSIESSPKSKVIKLPNNAGKMMLSVMNSKNRITILYKFYLTKSIFSPAEYTVLKEFYNQIVKTKDIFIKLKKM